MYILIIQIIISIKGGQGQSKIGGTHLRHVGIAMHASGGTNQYESTNKIGVAHLHHVGIAIHV